MLKFLLPFAAFFLAFFWGFSIWFTPFNKASIALEITSDKSTNIQLFYSKNSQFTEEESTTKGMPASKRKTINLQYDVESPKLRLDTGDQPGTIHLHKIKYKTLVGSYDYGIKAADFKQGQEIKATPDKEGYRIDMMGADSYFFLHVPSDIAALVQRDLNFLFNASVFAYASVLSLLLTTFLVRRSVILAFFQDIIQSRRMILNLSRNDFRTKYAGSYLGFVWGYIQPIITIAVYWFVFQVGLKVTPIDNDVPFALWFISGLIPWFFFSDALSNATNSFMEYNFLVKKVVFKINIIPFVKILSSLYVHILFAFALYVIYFSYGEEFSSVNIQILYYSFCAVALALAMSLLTASLVVFFKDLGQIIAIVLQVGMWLTPIMWSEKILSPAYSWMFKTNPMYYVTSGYRDSLFTQVWFVEHPYLTVWFWSFTLASFLLGLFVFKKLKPHFADVL